MNNIQLERHIHARENDYDSDYDLKQYVLDLAICIVAIHLPIESRVVDLDY